jgi:integrase
VNKLRAMVRTAFNRGRRAGLVHGQNPVSDTKPRKVPKRAPAFLEPHEVARLLAELSDEDRPLIATALYAGLRKGELFGLAKRDVDLSRRLLTVRRSYDNDTNKSAREEAVPIASALVPCAQVVITRSRTLPRTRGGVVAPSLDAFDGTQQTGGRSGPEFSSRWRVQLRGAVWRGPAAFC